jgi:hypothetical protein
MENNKNQGHPKNSFWLRRTAKRVIVKGPDGIKLSVASTGWCGLLPAISFNIDGEPTRYEVLIPIEEMRDYEVIAFALNMPTIPRHLEATENF